MSGTNVHLIVEEAAKSHRIISTMADAAHPRLNLLTLSAKSPAALRASAKGYLDFCAELPDSSLAALCACAQMRRGHFPHRAGLVVSNGAELTGELAALAFGKHPVADASGKAPRIALMFTGQGSQYAGMGRELYREFAVFRDAIDLCDRLLTGLLEHSIVRGLYGPQAEQPAAAHLLAQAEFSQPAMFALQYSLAKLYLSWGVKPSAVLGHSLGEYAAACMAGCLALEDALRLVAERGRLMSSLSPHGGMLAAFAAPDVAKAAIERLGLDVDVACVNGPDEVVLSGPITALDALAACKEFTGVRVQRLDVTHAFHSRQARPIADTFRSMAGRCRFARPILPFYSTVTGCRHDDPLNPAYLGDQICSTVLFDAALGALLRHPVDLIVEVGPKPVLSGIAARHRGADAARFIAGLDPQHGEARSVLSCVASLYTKGCAIDWPAFSGPRERHFTTLPTYRFQRRSYWWPDSRRVDRQERTQTAISPPYAPAERVPAKQTGTPREEIEDAVRRIFAEAVGGPVEPGARMRSQLGVDSLMWASIQGRIISGGLARQLPPGLYAEDSSVRDVVAYIGQAATKTTDATSTTAPTADLTDERMPPLDSAAWIPVRKEWVHKKRSENVLLMRIQRAGEGVDLFVGEVLLHRRHPFFFEHDQDHVPGMYLLEAVRQQSEAIAHAFFDVPLASAFTLNRFECAFEKYAELDRALYLVSKVIDKLVQGGQLAQCAIATRLVQDNQVIARFVAGGAVMKASVYRALRNSPARTAEDAEA